MPEFKQNYNDKFHNKELKRGVLTGYSYLDYIKNGFNPSELILIAAESGGGKSLLLNNLAIQMWMQKNSLHSKSYTRGYNVLYFGLEMCYSDCARRTLARIADVDIYGLRDISLIISNRKGKNRFTIYL